MKRLTGFIMVFVFVNSISAGLFAQESAQPATPLANPLATSSAPQAEPQFALSMLDEYFQGLDKKNRKVGNYLFFTGGTVFALGAVGTVFSFAAPEGVYPSEDGRTLSKVLSISFTGVGLGIATAGAIVLVQPKDKYKKEYATLYSETDPVVQEALAYGIMKDLADSAKRARITGGIIGIATPVALIGVKAITAAATNDWDKFNNSTLTSLTWTIPNFISGFVMLIGGTSAEERMLETYRTTYDAYSAKRK